VIDEKKLTESDLSKLQKSGSVAELAKIEKTHEALIQKMKEIEETELKKREMAIVKGMRWRRHR